MELSRITLLAGATAVAATGVVASALPATTQGKKKPSRPSGEELCSASATKLCA